MEHIEHKDEKGRLYEALQGEGGNIIILGPPEGLVDTFDIPEPFATNLHNAMYHRRLFNLGAVQRSGNSLHGALQEAYRLDVQRLTEAIMQYETTEVQHEQAASPHRS